VQAVRTGVMMAAVSCSLSPSTPPRRGKLGGNLAAGSVLMDPWLGWSDLGRERTDLVEPSLKEREKPSGPLLGLTVMSH
jgi:hypothetical protein